MLFKLAASPSKIGMHLLRNSVSCSSLHVASPFSLSEFFWHFSRCYSIILNNLMNNYFLIYLFPSLILLSSYLWILFFFMLWGVGEKKYFLPLQYSIMISYSSAYHSLLFFTFFPSFCLLFPTIIPLICDIPGVPWRWIRKSAMCIIIGLGTALVCTSV